MISLMLCFRVCSEDSSKSQSKRVAFMNLPILVSVQTSSMSGSLVMTALMSGMLRTKPPDRTMSIANFHPLLVQLSL